ncbi:hypothetical protein [Suipraeoptans intestinalis]|uniref:hypothetical protein n=1 Tax=Suipraeoptans intestinalis TaxID=2606628 RepID=UPI0023F45A77|nr:hypothetical protein [Suipraeoptans intestinalis]MDD7771064.1 hypothetical protein [Suipraeoptans intestinalis]MDY3121599.1 hypothetical protein [Suipraeoptans intestinalis]
MFWEKWKQDNRASRKEEIPKESRGSCGKAEWEVLEETVYGPFLPEEFEFDQLEIEEGKKKKWKTPTVLARILILEAGVAALTLVVMILVLTNVLGAESAVRRYAEARSDKDWNAMYEMLEYRDVPEGFLGKRAFVTAMTVAGGREVGEPKKIRKVAQTGKRARFCICYEKNQEEFWEEIGMVRKGLFWKVEDKGLLIRQVDLKVPRNAGLRLDAVPVSQRVKPVQTETCDIYRVPGIFGYVHYVEIKREGMEDIQKIVDLSKRGYDEVQNPVEIAADPNILPESVQQVSSQAVQEFQTLMEGSLKKDEVGKIEILGKMHKTCKKMVHEKYRGFRDHVLCGKEKNTEVATLLLSSGEATARAEERGKKGETIIRVDLSGEYTCQYEEGQNISAKKGTYAAVLWYIQQGDTWKIYDIAFPDL